MNKLEFLIEQSKHKIKLLIDEMRFIDGDEEYWSHYYTLKREKKWLEFVTEHKPRLEEFCLVTLHESGNFFVIENDDYHYYYYPKSDRALDRNTAKWISYALEIIEKNVTQ